MSCLGHWSLTGTHLGQLSPSGFPVRMVNPKPVCTAFGGRRCFVGAHSGDASRSQSCLGITKINRIRQSCASDEAKCFGPATYSCDMRFAQYENLNQRELLIALRLLACSG